MTATVVMTSAALFKKKDPDVAGVQVPGPSIDSSTNRGGTGIHLVWQRTAEQK